MADHAFAVSKRDKWDKKRFLKKQSGEVAENKEKGYMNSQNQTGKQSGEVIENTWRWKKQTGTNRKTRLPILLKIQEAEKGQKNKPEE